MTSEELLALAARYEKERSQTGLKLTPKEVTLFIKALREMAEIRARKEKSRSALQV